MRVRRAHFIAFLELPIFLVGVGPGRVDAVAMSGELQITSFCTPQRMDAEILAVVHIGGYLKSSADNAW